jgi:chromosome partitioning protein
VIYSVGERYGLDVLDPPVPKSVRVSEAPGRGRSVLEHAPSSPSAEAYRALAALIDPVRVPVAVTT